MSKCYSDDSDSDENNDEDEGDLDDLEKTSTSSNSSNEAKGAARSTFQRSHCKFNPCPSHSSTFTFSTASKSMNTFE